MSMHNGLKYCFRDSTQRNPVATKAESSKCQNLDSVLFDKEKNNYMKYGG